ncbi:MAG TPA: ABC transporter ATP-binding protein [Acidimicrobiales bacterium]|nr:ABC transporter ATP-binding protein [Acidimicrobiales bacterium]
MADAAIVVDGVSKRFRLYHERNRSLKATVLRGGRARYEEFWALRDVSLEIEEGKTYGLVGENGSGKSTLLKCIARILRPDAGSIRSHGKMAALLELGSGFHPELSGRENVFLNGSILGLSKRDLTARFDDIVGFAGLERFIDQPVKNYSSGMYVRLGFSVAINVDPDILLVDEVLAVGDAVFQRRCNEKFADFRRAGKTVVVVSHASEAMRTMCDKVAWLHDGRVVGEGRPEEVVDDYVDQGHEDRVEVAAEVAESRWGSGEVRLTKVQLVDAGGREVTHPSTGDAVTIRLRYRATTPISKPVFGLALETLDGTWLWAHHTRDAGFVPDEIAGEGTVELHVPRLMLQPGTYDLSASVVDYTTTHQYDYLRRCLRFDVEHGTPRESGGYVALGGAWSSESFDA